MENLRPNNLSEKIDEIQMCLDFTNTMDWHASQNPVETLSNYGDLVSWCRQHESLSSDDAETLLDISKRYPVETALIYRQAILLREAIYRILTAQVHARNVDEEDLTLINAAIAKAYNFLRIRPVDHVYTWEWSTKAGYLDSYGERLLWPIVHAAASLLTSPELLERVGQCADERGCGWLFLDLSKNHSRRWCDIKDCGNVAKQRRHYRKERLLQGGAA